MEQLLLDGVPNSTGGDDLYHWIFSLVLLLSFYRQVGFLRRKYSTVLSKEAVKKLVIFRNIL